MKEPKNKIRIYRRAIKKWGEGLQHRKTIEEMGELIVALSKLNLQKIFEEMADVEIMLEQMKVVFGCKDIVKLWKIEKLKDLKEMLNEAD